MILRVFLLLLYSSFTQNIFSQFYIKGRVTDSETQPLRGASVYINNTTKGTVTDDNGEFQLGPFEPGRYEVVASYVGYDALLYSADIKTSDFRIRFKLNKKEALLREVIIVSNELRKRYLEIFKKYVLGISNAAERCLVKNIDEVQFASGDTRDEIIAHTDKELEIENPELGYTLYFELVSFYYNKATSGSHFFGYTRYVDWAKDEQSKKKWVRKRKQAYMGSTVHFFRSLLKKELSNEGFAVYQLSSPQKSKQDSGTVKVPSQKNNPAMRMAVKLSEDSMVRLYPDSVYRMYELLVAGGWRIIYAKNTDLKDEISGKMFLPQPQIGTIVGFRLREAPALITEKGTLLTPLGLYFDGIWAYERLANMLPEDYEVE